MTDKYFCELPLQTIASGTTTYHLQRALPGGIVLMELAFQVRLIALHGTTPLLHIAKIIMLNFVGPFLV